jgi:tetratricopeptide (TPR) repeat protein/outer membrane protein assembly factor BamB
MGASTMSTRLLLAAALLGMLGAAPAQQQQEETVYIDEVKKEFIERFQRLEDQKDWKQLFETHARGIKKDGHRLVPVEKGPNPDRYTSVGEYLTQRLSKLPPEAWEYYRLVSDGPAKAAIDRAREENDRAKLERAAEEYFFAGPMDEVIDELATGYLDEGRVEEAIFAWNRLLRYYPGASIPRPVTAARLAHACRLAENESALASLKAFVAAEKIDGPVQVGGKSQPLSAWLPGVAVPPRATVVRPPKVPVAFSPEDRDKRRVLGVRNDIRRWTYDFSQDKSEPQAQTEVNPRARMIMARRGMEVPAAPQFGEFPLFPAHARVRGRDFVLFTDGTRLLAIDPAKVKGASTTGGVYWKYPPDKAIPRPNAVNNPGVFIPVNRPYVGVAVDGEHAIATMYSPASMRPRDNNPNNFDFFEGTTALKCVHIPSGRLVWDTDLSPLLEDMKTVCKEFWDRNWSFSSAPIVRGDRIYVGIGTTPVGEQESRVLCLDRKTGKPLWCTLVASLIGGGRNAWGWGNGRVVAYQTLLAEQGGILYVQSSLGAVAAVHGATGSILWLSRYKRAGIRMQAGGPEPGFARPANWPVVHHGTLFVLPQDRAELLGYDKMTGKVLELPAPKTREGDLDWRNMTHLAGVVDDWLVLGGAVSYVVRLGTWNAYSLASSNTSRAGHGVIDGDLVYLPATGSQGGNPVGVLAIYDTRTWKSLDQIPWKEPGEHGNLLIAGNYLVVATSKVSIYTDVETLRSEYARRLNLSPPHAASLLEFGDVMRENDRLEEAAEAYLAFIDAARGDPAFDVKVRAVKGELHGIFVRRGDEASGRGDFARALEHYTFAKGFAFDDRTQADATRRMAETFERLQRWKEAVGAYQELVEKGRGLFHRKEEEVMKLWEHARGRIQAIVAQAPDAYEDVERRAKDALQKAADGGAEAFRDVMDRFPNSQTAREAWTRMKDLLLKQGRFDRLRSLYNDLKDRFKVDLDFDATKELLELLEKLGDLERFRFETGKFSSTFADRKVGETPAKDWAEDLLRRLEARHAADAPLEGPLQRLGELEASKPAADALHGLPAGHRPLQPRGVEPPGFPRHAELFVLGSAVELRDLKEGKALWTRPHPGAWLGASFREPDGQEPGVRLMDVKKGSPAEKAGLRRDDLLVSLDGEPVRADALSARLAELAPGAGVELLVRRPRDAARKDFEEIRGKVRLAGHPPDLRPAVVGAAWTRDYGLAVAWEDLVASLDPATGAVRWTFRGLRDRFHVRSFHATDGRVYVYEANRPDRDHDVFRVHSDAARKERDVFTETEAHHRLLCLSDFTGDVVWARAFNFDAQNPHLPVQPTFLGRYLSDQVVFLVETLRPGVKEWTLWVLPADRYVERAPLKRVLPGQVMATALDEANGILYYVTELSNDRKERYLYSLLLDPSKRDAKPLELALHQKYMPPQHALCSLAVDAKHLLLLVAPPQAGGDYALWSFLAADGKEYRKLALLEDRTLPAAKPPATSIDREGRVYVYNVPRAKPGVPAGGRAFVTALRPGAPPAEDPVVWDAVAPVASAPAGLATTVLADPGTFVVFSASRAAVPGQAGESGTAVVYDKRAEGYLHAVHTDLPAVADGLGGVLPVATWWRGRLYVSAKSGLQVFQAGGE